VLNKPHKKLDVWKKAINLVQQIYDLTKTFPKNEDYSLSSQMRRAAISVPSNIAEGAARQTKKEFIQFLHMSQGSLSELDTHLEIAIRLGYLSDDQSKEPLEIMQNVDRMLSGLIKSLKK
jgi:S23 ribosomal protein.